MKGSIIDFLNLASENPQLGQALVDLATKHDFEFTDELSEDELEAVAGGGTDKVKRIIVTKSIKKWTSSLGDMSSSPPASGIISSSTLPSIPNAQDIKRTGGSDGT